jgi:polyisoprenoid-binding protein YceI
MSVLSRVHEKLSRTAAGLVLVLAAGAAGSLQAAEYVIDGTDAGMHASVNFQASHMGISHLWGRFNDITGSFSYDAANPGASSITVRIDPASIDTNHAERDAHLSSPDFLNVAAFPEAGFTSTAISELGNGRFQVTGDFTLHGVTREISFEAVRTGEGESPFGDYRVGFAAQFELDMREWGINLGPNSTLLFNLAIEGIRR